MEALGAFQERLRGVETRLDANHRSISDQRATNARQDTEIAVIHTELSGVREDIAEIKVDLTEAREEQKDEMTWLRRGVWTAAATMAGLMLTMGGLIVAILNG